MSLTIAKAEALVNQAVALLDPALAVPLAGAEALMSAAFAAIAAGLHPTDWHATQVAADGTRTEMQAVPLVHLQVNLADQSLHFAAAYQDQFGSGHGIVGVRSLPSGAKASLTVDMNPKAAGELTFRPHVQGSHLRIELDAVTADGSRVRFDATVCSLGDLPDLAALIAKLP